MPTTMSATTATEAPRTTGEWPPGGGPSPPIQADHCRRRCFHSVIVNQSLPEPALLRRSPLPAKGSRLLVLPLGTPTVDRRPGAGEKRATLTTDSGSGVFPVPGLRPDARPGHGPGISADSAGPGAQGVDSWLYGLGTGKPTGGFLQPAVRRVAVPSRCRRRRPSTLRHSVRPMDARYGRRCSRPTGRSLVLASSRGDSLAMVRVQLGGGGGGGGGGELPMRWVCAPPPSGQGNT